MEDLESIRLVEEIRGLVTEELQVVSYKWAARHFSITSNTAKRLLFRYAESNRGKACVTYLVAGWSKDKEHVVKLVDASKIGGVRQMLDPVTSMHVYSVSPLQPMDALAVWQEDYRQSHRLLEADLAQHGAQGVSYGEVPRSNQCSSVRFLLPPGAIRPPPRPANASDGGSSAATSPPKVGSPVRPAAVPAPAAAPLVRSHSAQGRPVSSPPKPANPDKEPVAVAPSLAKAPSLPPVPKAKASNNPLSAMWAKAPPAKAPTAPPTAKPNSDDQPLQVVPSATAASADLPQPSAPVSMAAAPASTSAAAGRGGAAPAAAAPSVKRSRRTIISDSDDDEVQVEEPPKRSAGVGRQADTSAAQPLGAAQEEEEAVPQRAANAPSAAPAASAAAPLGAPTGVVVGTGRKRKVMRVTINECGEEVVEEVMEDVTTGTATGPQEAAAHERNTDVEAVRAEAKALQAGKAAAAKPPAKSAKASGGAKGKAASGGAQQGIKSFFAKK